MRLSNLDHLSTANHGVLSQALSGLSRSSWYRAIAAGQLEQISPGVARLHGSSRIPEQRINAAVLACGPASLASHRSAAYLWGLPRGDDEPLDVITPTSRRRFDRFDDLVIQHSEHGRTICARCVPLSGTEGAQIGGWRRDA